MLQPSYPSCKYNNWNAATSKQSKQQNACQDYIHPLNNKTTVTYVIMQTTQKDSFFFNNWFIIWNIWGYGIRSFRFKVVLIRTQAVKFCKKFDYFKKSLHLNKKTFWLNINQSLSQVCETIYWNIHRLKLFDNWINCNCCCCWYTSNHRGMLTQGWCWGKDKQAFLVVKLTFLLDCIRGSQQRFPLRCFEKHFSGYPEHF